MPRIKAYSGIHRIASEIRYLVHLCRFSLFSGHKNSKNAIDKIVSSYFELDLSVSEQKATDAIEKLRSMLLSSQDLIPKTDHGHGSQILTDENPMEKISDICRAFSKSKSDCLFLFSLVKLQMPTHCLELGTCLGVSAAYIATAQRQNGHGFLVTLEGSPGRARVAEENLEKLNLRKYVKVVQGRFQDTLDAQLNELQNVDFAFIDGHHDEKATIDYFNRIRPYFKNGGIMVFDDIFWSAGMHRAWKTINKSDSIVDRFVFKGMGVVEIRGQESGVRSQGSGVRDKG